MPNKPFNPIARENARSGLTAALGLSMTSAKAVLDTLRPQAETTLDGLLKQPYDLLLTLPPVNEVVIPDVSRKASLTTYRDMLPDGRLQVVVQLVVTACCSSRAAKGVASGGVITSTGNQMALALTARPNNAL